MKENRKKPTESGAHVPEGSRTFTKPVEKEMGTHTNGPAHVVSPLLRSCACARYLRHHVWNGNHEKEQSS